MKSIGKKLLSLVMVLALMVGFVPGMDMTVQAEVAIPADGSGTAGVVYYTSRGFTVISTDPSNFGWQHSVYGKQGVSCLFDQINSGDQKMGGSLNGTLTIIFRYKEAIAPDRYFIVSGRDGLPSRNPLGWVLYGSTDQSNWVKLSQQTCTFGTAALTPFNYPISGNNAYQYFKLEIANNGDMELSEFYMSGKPASLNGRGTVSDPYLIGSADDWKTFAGWINAGTNVSACYQLTADISGVSAMVGTSGHPFSGSFDGNGKTLTVGISGNGEEGISPFHYIKNATIKNLTVAGTINGGDKNHTSGVVGFSDGNANLIENCVVRAQISVSGDRIAGGFLGHGKAANTTIKNCAFAGRISANLASGFIGWAEAATITMQNCVEAGTYANYALFHPFAVYYNAYNPRITLSGCYYHQGAGNPGQTGYPAALLGVSGTPAYKVTLTGGISTAAPALYTSGNDGYYAAGTAVALTAQESGAVFAATKVSDNSDVTGAVINGATLTVPAYDLSVAHAAASVTSGSATAYYPSFSTALSAWANGSTLTLRSDVTTATTITVSGTKTLDLNGCGVKMTGNGSVFSVTGSLTINDSSPNAAHKFTVASPAANGAGLATVNDADGTMSFTGGYITGGNAHDGGALYINGGSVTLNGGTLIGNKANTNGGNGGAVRLDGGAKYTMDGGAILHNGTNSYGGAISLGSGTFTLKRGTISHNRSTGNGGAIHTNGSSNTVIISGGSIINNHTNGSDSAYKGGGVIRANGTALQISGNPVISGNTSGSSETADNVFLRSGETITVTGALTNTAPIGVTVQGGAGVFTSGGIAKDYADNFTSDNAAYTVQVEGNELKLALPPVASVMPSGGTASTYPSFSDALSAWTDGSTLTLLSDVTTSSTVNITGTKTLNLNGHGIKATGTGSVFSVTGGAKLTLNDSDPNVPHKYTIASPKSNGAGLAVVDETGDQTFTGGYITGGNSTSWGGGVLINGGSLTMNGGTVIGNNTANHGGGIALRASGDTFIMNGGALIGNTGKYGGGLSVAFAGSCTVNGGKIQYNCTGNNGGGIHTDGAGQRASLTITGGTITNNYCAGGSVSGGGVLVSGTTFNLSGSVEIKDNLRGSNADNLYLTKGYTVNVADTLSNSTPIGVTMQSGAGVFTSSTNTAYNDPSKFVSDNSSYTVGKNADGQLFLAELVTVTFDANGGSEVASQTVASTTTVTKPDDPTKTGYTFDGWCADSALETPFDFSSAITANMTLYAKWSINQYTVTFDTDGGSMIAPIVQDYGTAVTAPADPTRTGYTFTGWDQAIPTTMPAENVTVKANWGVNQYTIMFDTDGGSAIEPITQDYGTTVTVPADPIRTGYTFAGWDQAVPTTMPAENVTIKAQWTINQYTVTFDTDGGSAIEPITQDYGTEVTVPEAPIKADYAFVGWNTEADATGTPILPGASMTLTTDFTLYGQWTSKPLYEVAGVVKQGDDPAIGVSVQLIQGEKKIAVTETDADGAFSIFAPEGIYNIVAEQDGKTKTKLITLDATQSVEIIMPRENVNSELTLTGSATPNVMVGGLDELAEASGESGKAVTVSMTVEETDNAANADEIQILAASEEHPNQSLDCFEIKIEKHVDTDAPVLITETGDAVLEIIVPYHFAGKENVEAYRYHNGAEKLEKLDSRPDGGYQDGTYYSDPASGLIYIYASKFSTYAIGYTQCYNINGAINYGAYTGTVTVSLLNRDKEERKYSTAARLTNGSGAYSFVHVLKGRYLLTTAWIEGGKETTLEETVEVQ